MAKAKAASVVVGTEWWWLSYTDDSGFKGSVVLGPTTSFLAAVSKAQREKLAPGGQVRGLFLSEKLLDLTEESLRNRFLNVEESNALMDIYAQDKTKA